MSELKVNTFHLPEVFFFWVLVANKVVSSPYRRMEIFKPPIDSPSVPASGIILIMSFVYTLNSSGEIIRSWGTPAIGCVWIERHLLILRLFHL